MQLGSPVLLCSILRWHVAFIELMLVLQLLSTPTVLECLLYYKRDLHLSFSLLQITIERESGLDVSSPKHGKVDPDNMPHVGGNMWAGGTGFSKLYFF